MKTETGSLLIEAVLSTVIIAVSLTVIIQSLLSNYHSMDLHNEYVQALSILEDHLSGLSIDSSDSLINGQDSNVKYLYHHSFSNIDKNLKKVMLTVQWPAEGHGQRLLSVSTWVFHGENT